MSHLTNILDLKNEFKRCDLSSGVMGIIQISIISYHHTVQLDDVSVDQLIGVGSITEVKQRRVQFIIEWVTAWDCQVLNTLGHETCSDVVSWGSENHVKQMARLTEIELDVKESQYGRRRSFHPARPQKIHNVVR